MLGGQLVGVGEDVSGQPPLPQCRLELDHWFYRDEDVGEALIELGEIAAEAGDAADLGVELLGGHGAHFILKEQRGLADILRNLLEGHRAARGDSPRRDAIIEIHQDFAQVKDDDRWESACGGYISCIGYMGYKGRLASQASRSSSPSP